MSGTATADLTKNQVDTVLQVVANSLRVVLTSALRTQPGNAVTASLIPASPMLDVSELVNGALNIGWTVKDVLYKDAQAVIVPPSGDLEGSSLVQTIAPNGSPGAAEILGGQPFPSPAAVVGTAVKPTTTNIPGLLGQVFGDIAIPRLKVRLDIEWKLRRRGKKQQEGKDFLALNGLASPTVSLLIPPVFDELRMDTIISPKVDLACLSAEVTLTLDSDQGTVRQTVETPSVPILILPLLIPTVVALFSEPNFEVRQGSWALLIVPQHSPLASAKHLFDALRKIEAVVDALSSIASLATWILGISELTSAVTDHPRLRFISSDSIGSFDDISIAPGQPMFLPWGDTDSDDGASSILMIGPEGAKSWFFNDNGTQVTNDPVWGTQGAYSLTITNELPFVMVRNLGQADASNEGPHSIPASALGDVTTDSYGDSPTWNDSMSSFAFDPAWLQQIDDVSVLQVVEPIADCTRRVRPPIWPVVTAVMKQPDPEPIP